MDAPILQVELFTQIRSDFEVNQYKIQAELKKISSHFRKNMIFPDLSHLIGLYRKLHTISTRLKQLRDEFPKRIKKLDFINETIEYEIKFSGDSSLSNVEELIEWGLPHIKAKIEEGKTIYEFVNGELELEEVGIMPKYTDEGYFFVPDNEVSKLLLYQYELSIFQRSSDKYRSLKTSFLKSINKKQVHHSPNSIKLDLIEQRKELPNPATYSFQTHLSFPFNETVLPVTKRKLMQRLV